jgi:TAG lipase/steryl ester hydrolase/phospholipase A2/LPA acyltransferase
MFVCCRFAAYRCAQMQYILPDWFPTKWLTLFTQPWEGDITVVLPSHLWNLGKTMVNPTTHDILAATKQGELAIWEKLSAIETNCTIEATLDACLARLTNKARERPLTGLTSRIPSWLSMPAVGQQAVASWGNPLDAGASPGGRLWHRSKSSQALLNATASSGHLPSLLQTQQVQQGSAATSPAAVGPGGAWYFAGGNAALSASTLLASAGVGGAVQKGDAAAAAAGSASPAAGAAAAAPAGLYGGVPATVSDAIAAMADGANMGGTHRGYSYTAAAMHSAHTQQHGSPAVAAAHAQAAAAAVAAHVGAAHALHNAQAGSVYGSSGGSSAGLVVGSPGSSGLAFGGSSAAGVSVPPTIHEGMPDDRPPRVTSWGSNDIADSVSDFPASCSAGGYHAAGSSGGSRASRAHQQAAAAAAAAAAGEQAAQVRAAAEEQQQQHEQPGTPDSVQTVSSSAAASSSGRHPKGSRRRSSASSTCSSGSSSSSRVQSEVVGQLDCCDSSVVTDIWSMFMPLATSSLALQAATASEGLDFIAP